MFLERWDEYAWLHIIFHRFIILLSPFLIFVLIINHLLNQKVCVCEIL